MNRHALLLAVLLPACKGGEDTGSPEASPVPEVHLLSPADGETFVEGDAVQLEAEVVDQDGNALQADEVDWSAPGWAGYQGLSGTVTDLPVGTYDLTVTARLGERSVSDSVEITVEPGDVDYAGDFQSQLEGTYQGYPYGPWHCDGPISFTLHGATGSLEGSGSCTIQEYPDYSFDFDVEGTVSGSQLSGSLSMEVEGQVYETPFSGTREASGHVTATFDHTYEREGDTLHLWGGFEADPQR